jgi:protein-tyrosine-phosphatase
MAEGIMRKIADEKKLNLYIFSAGISTTDGLPASANAITAAGELEADISMHQSRQLSLVMLDSADIILCMTAGHIRKIIEMFPENSAKLTDKIDVLGEKDVADPFGGGIEEYRRCAEELLYMIECRMDELEFVELEE